MHVRLQLQVSANDQKIGYPIDVVDSDVSSALSKQLIG